MTNVATNPDRPYRGRHHLERVYGRDWPAAAGLCAQGDRSTCEIHNKNGEATN